jgi:hypothetical protein
VAGFAGPQDVGSGFAWVALNNLGGPLTQMLMAEAIEPGSDPSYQLCKIIYAYHPVGAKMAEKPIEIAQSKPRVISIQDGPEERCVQAFTEEWNRLDATRIIKNLGAQSRVYGVASLGALANGVTSTRAFSGQDWAKHKLAFNLFDPLNTSGSLIFNQNPNAFDFQKPRDQLRVFGVAYEASRYITLLNEDPFYILWNNPGFGFNGRSVYQRALYPLKSFLYAMIADQMVLRKAGLLVAKMKTGGSIISNLMAAAGAMKRAILQQGQTNNVLEIGVDDSIETLNMQNIELALTTPRKNVLQDIAAAAKMPAIMLTDETFAEGFGEGSEDAEEYKRYIRNVREWLAPCYSFFDEIVMNRAWTPEFVEALKVDFPDYRKMSYEEAFYRFKNSYEATWPNLDEEPESKQVEKDDVKLKSITATVQVLLPVLDPENKARAVQFFVDNINENKLMFTSGLEFDPESFLEWLEEQREQQAMMAEDEEETAPKAPVPFSNRA